MATPNQPQQNPAGPRPTPRAFNLAVGQGAGQAPQGPSMPQGQTPPPPASYQPPPYGQGGQRPYQQNPSYGQGLLPESNPLVEQGRSIHYDQENPQGAPQRAYSQYHADLKSALRPPQYQDILTQEGGLPSALNVQADPRGFQALQGLATNYDQGPLAQALQQQGVLQGKARRDAAVTPAVRDLSQALNVGAPSPKGALTGAEQAMGRGQAQQAGLVQALQGYGKAGQQMMGLDQANVERLSRLRDLEQKRDVQAFSDYQKLLAGDELAAAAAPEDKKWYEFWK